MEKFFYEIFYFLFFINLLSFNEISSTKYSVEIPKSVLNQEEAWHPYVNREYMNYNIELTNYTDTNIKYQVSLLQINNKLLAKQHDKLTCTCRFVKIKQNGVGETTQLEKPKKKESYFKHINKKNNIEKENRERINKLEEQLNENNKMIKKIGDIIKNQKVQQEEPKQVQQIYNNVFQSQMSQVNPNLQMQPVLYQSVPQVNSFMQYIPSVPIGYPSVAY